LHRSQKLGSKNKGVREEIRKKEDGERSTM
jgi:hypothetical protein